MDTQPSFLSQMDFMTDVLQPNWSRNGTVDESEDTIASRFERQVAAVPEKLAIVTDEASLTYRALDQKASRSRRRYLHFLPNVTDLSCSS